MTKVLFNDYIDGNNDNDPINSFNDNHGSWFVLQYETTITDARQLPTCAQAGNNTTAISYAGTKLYDTYLQKVITPNQWAQYNYTVSRADDLWFPIQSMDWYGENDEDVRGLPSAAKRGKAKSTTAIPVNRKVLDNITVYSKSNIPIKNIKFKTDYSLRPSSFHSYTKDPSSNFVTLDKNRTAACLTLKSIDIADMAGNNVLSIFFKYNTKNPYGWSESSAHNPDPHSLRSAKFYKELKDVWGYYYPNENEHNNFVDQIEQFYADAWSLTSVEFPSGLEVKWEYESNRYDDYNGQQANKNDGIKKMTVCGGLRVKNVSSVPKFGKEEMFSFFYTENPLEIEPIIDPSNLIQTNNSGYVAVEPFNYLSADDYRESKKTVGGLYTPTKVAYSEVKMVKNYDFVNHCAPNGYTVYNFTSTNEYPNSGGRGDIDNSWKRGLLKSKSIYNKEKQLVSKEETKYDIIDDNQFIDISGPNNGYFICYPYGVTRISEKIVTQNGLTTTKSFEYATGKDSVISTKLKYLSNYNWNVNPINFKYCRQKDYSGDIVFTKNFGNADKNDLLVGMGLKADDFSGSQDYNYNYLILALAEDIELTSSQNGNWKYGILNIGKIPLTDCYFGGFNASDFNNNGIMDLILGEILNDGHIQYHTFLDIDENVFKNKQVTDPNLSDLFSGPIYTGETVTHYSVKSPTKFSTEPYKMACAGAANIGGDPDKKDIVFLVFWKPYNVPITENSLLIYVAMDVDDQGRMTNSAKSEIFRPTVNLDLISAKLIDDDKDGLMNDMIITGYNWQSRLSTRLLKNLSITGANVRDQGVVTFTDHNLVPLMGGDKIVKTENTNDGMGAAYLNNKENPVYIFMSYASQFRVIDGRQYVKFDYDGIPNRSLEKNGKDQLVHDNIMAYFEYPELASINTRRINEVCQSNVYVIKQEQLLPVNSKASKWSKFKMKNGTDSWKPFVSYVWKSPMNANGETIEQITPFNFSGINNSDKWAMTDSISKLNENQSISEIAKPSINGPLFNTTINGHNNYIPIGLVVNSRFNECGIYTCDYDLNDDGSFFDKENGWRKGAGNERGLPGPVSVVSEEAKHFGNKGVKVTNAFGPSRAFKLEQGKDYIFSAWIKKVSGYVPLQNGMVIGVDYRKCKSAAGVWPFELYLATESPTISCNSNLDTVQHGDWYYIELSVNASEDIPITKWNEGYQYASAWVGVPNGNGNNGTATVYIDDIRFYPKSALVTSTYYDKFLGQPIISIDANNNPSKRITYDGFGRPVKWEKLDLSKGTGESGYTTTVMTKEYNFLDDCLSRQHINLYHPNGAETFIPGQGIPISWAMLEQGTVTIAYKKEGDAVYTALYTQSYNPGQNSYTWSIPGELGGDYKIKVTNSRNDGTSCSDESDATFRINAVAIQAPISTSEWMAGTKRQIKWSFSGPSTVDICYNNGTSRILIASNISNTGGNGTYEWEIPLDYKTERNSKIVITNHENSGQLIESQTFLIVERSRFIQKWLMGLFGK